MCLRREIPKSKLHRKELCQKLEEYMKAINKQRRLSLFLKREGVNFHGPSIATAYPLESLITTYKKKNRIQGTGKEQFDIVEFVS